MVDSILTNQAPIAQQSNNNRSITSAAVSNASSIPEVEQSDQVVVITPRVMDADANSSFSTPAEPENLTSIFENSITSGVQLRPPLENFNPIEITTERALENRVADIEIRTNDLVDETDSQVNLNNRGLEAFTTVDNDLQQAVDISA